MWNEPQNDLTMPFSKLGHSLHSFRLQFGDISRNLDQQAKSRVSELTGKDEYKFGDLSKWADSQAKEKIANYTGKVDYEVSKYGFGISGDTIPAIDSWK
mgnify:CR=1 FL=1